MAKENCDEEILRLVNESGYLSIKELSEKIFTSTSTVRRSLARLENEGLIRRRHGGAESIVDIHPPILVRRQHNRADKAYAAAMAAEKVKPDSVIFIDESSTVQYMIPYLSGIKGLTVWTSGADTVLRLAEANIRAFSTGGELLAQSKAYAGAAASDAVRRIWFDAMFFSSAGFDGEVISDWSEEETALRRTVIEQSKKKYFLADSTKHGKRFPYIVCRVSELDAVFCRVTENKNI